MNRHHFIFALILFVTFIFRFPSLFEPFWYGDEGIFAAVANDLNQGEVLYRDTWDNKPPMIYLTYALIFKIFGVSMFWLRLVTIIAVLTTAAIIYEVAQAIFGKKRALVATFIFGFLSSLRLIEGNLALTEIFMILPISAAMLFAIKRNYDYVSLFGAGILFGIASLYKQVGALEAAALGIFIFFVSSNFWEFVKKGIVLTLGFSIPYLVTIAYFAPKGLLNDYIFAAYTYYRIYLEESPQYAIFISLLKILPIVAAITYGFYKKIKGNVETFHLLLLWTAFSLWGSYFSGRTYGHYLVQAVPAVSLLIASIRFKRPKFSKVSFVFMVVYFIPIIILTRILFENFISGGPVNQVKYWKNFVDYATGTKNQAEYSNFFDSNVNRIMALSDYLASKNAYGDSVYIWGDWPWLYAIADLKNPSRYVTSFHVFGVPSGQEEVTTNILSNSPTYIIKPETSIGYFAELEQILLLRYILVSKIEGSEVFQLATK